MMRIMTLVLAMVCTTAAFAADKPSNDTPNPTPRYSIFSTSTDWEGLTGLRLAEYRGTFITDKKLVGPKGLVLYYLDGFPCYGLGSWARAWISPTGKADEHLRIVCVYPPQQIQFAWRNATNDAIEARTTGLLTCPVTTDGREITINLGKCVREKDWADKR